MNEYGVADMFPDVDLKDFFQRLPLHSPPDSLISPRKTYNDECCKRKKILTPRLTSPQDHLRSRWPRVRRDSDVRG